MYKTGKYKIIMMALCLLELALPAYSQISVNGKSLIEHGSNANEMTEYVTVGSTMRYYLMPDASINTGFNPAGDLNAVANNDAIVSNFFWNITGGIGGPATSVGGVYKGNYVSISWTSTGTGTIESYERSTSGCDGNTLVTNVTVIPAPTVTSITIGNINCTTTPVNVAVPASATLVINSSTPGTPKGFEVSFTLTGPGGYSQTKTGIAVSDLGVINMTALSLPNLTNSGVYTFTVTGVSDRISTKCSIVPTVISVSKSFFVIPTPITGKTKHVPNDAAW